MRASRTLACLVGLGVFGFACHGGPAVLARLDEARSLAADVRVQFNKADDSSNRAVMADTDEASIAFAHDAAAASTLIERDIATLAPLLDALGLQTELESVQAFRTRFADYNKLDREILALAVENTNLKAQRLSFGPARAAADELRDSLARLASNGSAKDRCRIDGLVAQVMLAVREIQLIQAPHIAEANDAVMTRMEQDMAALDTKARDGLAALQKVVNPSGRPNVTVALAALDKFKALAAQIVSLSRRNTNVRSLDLSLRIKPGLVNACDETLRSVQAALGQEVSKATR